MSEFVSESNSVVGESSSVMGESNSVNSKNVSIAVLGGGFSGLVGAYELLKKGRTVKIFEKESCLAGYADSMEICDKRIEKFYHHFFKSDLDLIFLLEELGLKKDILWLESSMGYFTDNKIYDFGTPISLLKFRPLSFWGKFGFGISTLRLLFTNDWKKLEGITAEKWLLKNAGKQAYEKVWKPLLLSKFKERAGEISMAWLWGKIKLRGSSKENGKEVLGYLNGSLEVMTQALKNKIEELGGQIFTDTEVVSLSKKENSKWEVSIKAEGNIESNEFDSVFSALPQPILNRLLKKENNTNEKLSIEKEVPHTAVICTLLELKNQYMHKYWLNIGDETLPFGGLIEHTNIISKDEYCGKNLLYISSYVQENSHMLDLSESDLLKEYIAGLKKVNPSFKEEDIIGHHIYKRKYAQPIITINYSDIKPDYIIEDGFVQANMAVIYPEDRGVNYAVRESKKAAALL